MRQFVNGRFLPCDGGEPFSVLVEKKGKIAYTGEEAPKAFAGAETIDLAGACAVPSFGDTHLHFQSWAHVLGNLDVRSAQTLSEMETLVKNQEASRPGKPLIAFGCSAHTLQEQRLPTRADLDAMTKTPLFMVKYDGHAAVANSAMLDRLYRKVKGVPGFDETSGWFYQDAFYKAADAVSRGVSPVELIQNIESAGIHLAEKGVSIFHAAEGMGYPMDLDVDLMRFSGRALPQSVTTFFQTMAPEKVKRRGMRSVGGCFANALDGCFGSQDAALSKPYTHDPTNWGHLFYSQKEVDDFVMTAHELGLQVALHAIGDAAVTQALNAFEKALIQSPRKDHRHILIHGCLISSGDITRMADLGITLAAQPPFLYWELEPQAYLDKILGDRSMQLMPFRALADAGVRMAGGSDAPTTLPDPMFSIWAACNHPNPNHSLSPMEALEMHTIRCAEAGFEEEERGSLSIGKRADFVVLDKDFLLTPKQEIHTIQVVDHYLQGHRFSQKAVGALSFLGRATFGRKRGAAL
ncbi:MAG: amidohydrolase [Desulfobacterales bacterium]|nr:amidohydrolase [Desulfobacterales bacterium]